MLWSRRPRREPWCRRYGQGGGDADDHHEGGGDGDDGAVELDRVEVTLMIIFTLFHKFRRQKNEQSKTGPSRVFCWMNLSCFLPKPDKFVPLLSFLEHLGYSLS